jgi:hypothetical protein
MAQSQSRCAKENRRRLARATARYFRELDEKAVEEENQLARDFSSHARSNRTNNLSMEQTDKRPNARLNNS